MDSEAIKALQSVRRHLRREATAYRDSAVKYYRSDYHVGENALLFAVELVDKKIKQLKEGV